MTGLIVAVVVVVTVVASVALARKVRHPEQAATHDDTVGGEETTSDRLYGHDDRPAGPDAEDPPAPG